MTDYEKGPELPPEYRERVDLSVLILRTGTPEAFTVHPSAVERAAEVLAAHQRFAARSCLCGEHMPPVYADSAARDAWLAAHQAEALAAAGLLRDEPADGVQAWPQEDA